MDRTGGAVATSGPSLKRSKKAAFHRGRVSPQVPETRPRGGRKRRRASASGLSQDRPPRSQRRPSRSRINETPSQGPLQVSTQGRREPGGAAAHGPSPSSSVRGTERRPSASRLVAATRARPTSTIPVPGTRLLAPPSPYGTFPAGTACTLRDPKHPPVRPRRGRPQPDGLFRPLS